MYDFSPRDQRQVVATVSPNSIEPLENRRLLSGSPITPFDTSSSPVAALSVNVSAGKKVKESVGTWTIDGGVPARSSGVIAVATVDWGDGKMTKAKFVDDGSGVVQIVGSHAWRQAGTFQTVVKVQEYPKGHKTQLTEIGEGTGSIIVSPKAQKLSLKGTFTGTYTSPLNNPDVRSYSFTGTGTAGTMGASDLSGTITPPGFIQSASTTGELTLTNDNGSVTIDLTGKPQPGGSPVPQKLNYVVTAGTGAFATAGGKGSVAVSLDSTANTFVMVIH